MNFFADGSVDENEEFLIENIECFDFKINDELKRYAKNLKISEEDSILAGYFAKVFADKILEGSECKITFDGDKISKIICDDVDYVEAFNSSPFALSKGKPVNAEHFNAELKKLRGLNYRVYNYNSHKIHKVNCKFGQQSQSFSVLPEQELPKDVIKCRFCLENRPKSIKKSTSNVIRDFVWLKGSVQIYFNDFTGVLKPNANCKTKYCKSVLKEINNAQNTIDMALYGYADVPEITAAIKAAISRGVKIRLVYDIDSAGQNFYPETSMLTDLIPDNTADIGTKSFQSALMHNKFLIIDNKTLISGSANLSTTDMSGFNSNVFVVIKSKDIAQVYTQEFEQMYGKKFHKLKDKIENKEKIKVDNSIVSIYFSPKDSVIESFMIPIINGAKQYIYLPIFVITHKNLSQALINAKSRGVDVRVILDATNACSNSSAHTTLRAAGVLVKVENYAGKMHSKSMIIDGKYVFMGSMNFSNSGENKNDENMLLIENTELAETYKKFFDYTWNRIPEKYLHRNVRGESKESIGSCSDGIDNNFDGKIDLQDAGCK